MTWLSTEIYQDFKWGMWDLVNIFNQQLLPAISKWAVLTKDYILDLFWRYIQYAIAMDIFTIVICTIVVILFFKFMPMVRRYDNEINPSWSYNNFPLFIFYNIFIGILSVICIAMAIDAATHLIQSIFIPELTIYEKIVQLKTEY